ncbi:MAG: hypothetical protein GC159_15425 [Phycisphaera sp.]|nr:hypothetical protein [Phycisphaera sp.]
MFNEFLFGVFWFVYMFSLLFVLLVIWRISESLRSMADSFERMADNTARPRADRAGSRMQSVPDPRFPMP